MGNLILDINFKSIRIKRFRSFQNEAIFEFAGAGPGLYFLKGINKVASGLGSNGSGKSTVIDALMWCLYGKTVRGLTNAHIVPWEGKGATEVELAVEVAGKIKRIQRVLNPNLLTVDGTEVGQDYIGTLIPIPMGIIPYTIVLGQKQPLFFDLTASEKLKVFSECLNLERWEERSSHASDLVKSLESEIQSKEIEVSGYTRQLAIFEDDLEKAKQQSKLWENDRSLKLASAEKDKKEIQDKIAKVMPERDTADLRLERACMELKALKPNLDQLYRVEKELGSKVSDLMWNKEQALKEIRLLKASLETIQKDHCPTCKQPLKSAKQRKELEDSSNKRIKELNIPQMEKDLDFNNTKYDKHCIAIIEQEKAQKKFEADEDEARNILGRLDPQIANWQAHLSALIFQLKEKEELDNPHTEQIQLLRKRKNQTESSIEETQKTIMIKREYCERVRPWIKWFKDIRMLMVEEILQELEIVSNGMIEEFGLVGWRIQYDVERETQKGTIARGLNISILSPDNKKPVKWEVWSGGEAQRLKLIGTAALSSVLLNHVGVTTNLMILDEPTESLSAEGVRDLVELLAQHAKETKKAVWIIDHHLIESTKLIQTVLVTKNKYGSVLEIV